MNTTPPRSPLSRELLPPWPAPERAPISGTVAYTFVDILVWASGIALLGPAHLPVRHSDLGLFLVGGPRNGRARSGGPGTERGSSA
jgi:hypothetical protein